MVMRVYSPQFKVDAVALYLSDPDHTFEGVGRDLGVARGTLRSWVQAEQARRGPAGTTSRDMNDKKTGSGPAADELRAENEALRKELAKVRKENQKLATERDILRKATKFFASEMTW